MRAVTLQGSWRPSCRIGPGPHGTWRAMPASVPQPTGAPDAACRQRRPASPHRCVGCAPYSRVWRQRPGLKDCHTLCPDTGVGVSPQWAVVVPPQWRPGSPPTAWHRARCSRNHNAQGAALSIHKETPLGTSLATIRRVGNQVPPKRALPIAPSADCHSQSTPSKASHPSTWAPHIRCKTPVSTHCDEWCWSPSSFGNRFHWHPLRSRKMMPLSICRGSARLRTGLGWVFLQDDRFDAFPKLVRHFPDGL